MNRRNFLKTAGMATAGFLLSSKGFTAAQPQRPNILFIMSDDHASHALSCYGSRINKTPNLDRIANEGMRFDNCFCTNSICEPSRAVILTGKYSHLNGVHCNGEHFDGSQQTVSKLLRQNGYQTAMIGKWHLNSEPTGFDYWCILTDGGGQGTYFEPVFDLNGKRRQIAGYTTDIITDQTIQWLDARKSDKPFFLMCHHKAPHRRWRPNYPDFKVYEDKEIPQPDTFDDDYSTRSDAAKYAEMTIEQDLDEKDLKFDPPEHFIGQQLKNWKYQRYMRDYLGCVASVDDNVGRLLDYLDKSGLAENTIVIYTSDQGFYLGDHGWFDKRFMYEESLRMPLLIRYPKTVEAGSVNKEMVLNLDFAPTFLDFAGVKTPDDMQGRSIKPLLEGESVSDWRDAMYYHYYEYPSVHMVKRHYGIRIQRYKLIHFYYDIDAWELYDLQEDPHELNNIYDHPDYAPIVVELKDKLRNLQSHYGDSDEKAKQVLNDYLAAGHGKNFMLNSRYYKEKVRKD